MGELRRLYKLMKARRACYLLAIDRLERKCMAHACAQVVIYEHANSFECSRACSFILLQSTCGRPHRQEVDGRCGVSLGVRRRRRWPPVMGQPTVELHVGTGAGPCTHATHEEQVVVLGSFFLSLDSWDGVVALGPHR